MKGNMYYDKEIQEMAYSKGLETSVEPKWFDKSEGPGASLYSGM